VNDGWMTLIAAGRTVNSVPSSVYAFSSFNVLRSEGVGELRIVQEHVVRQSIQEIGEVVLVLH
jgi:hypothetical protein